MKREGTDLAELEKETRSSDRLCFWGIEKFFDPKQCYKHFRKYFGDHEEAVSLLKLRNKPFFIVKFSKEMNCDDFNKQFAKNKRIRAKIVPDDIYEKNEFKDEDFTPIEEVKKPAEKNTRQPSQQ